MKTNFYPQLEESIKNLDTSTISEERKEILAVLTDYIQTKKDDNKEIRLNLICTHNSRRSHLSQIWAKVMAEYTGIQNVETYSGGTEATAMFPMIGETLKGQGFQIEALSEGNNPVYAIQYSEDKKPIVGFSKTYDHAFNPVNEFAAVMTCSSADMNCPFIPGAEKRISLTFGDPKAFDNTPQQAEKYLERSVQIATELLYVFQQVK